MDHFLQKANRFVLQLIITFKILSKSKHCSWQWQGNPQCGPGNLFRRQSQAWKNRGLSRNSCFSNFLPLQPTLLLALLAFATRHAAKHYGTQPRSHS